MTTMASAATFARLARRLGADGLRPELPEPGAP
jgi:DNA-binding MurR/RpiR family transcriptional regulator